MMGSAKKKTSRTKYNTAAIKEAADVMMVAQAIGMNIQHKRYYKNKVSVLCPSHDDRNHGSCFLTERGCRCYVCNESFDVFDMVKLHLNLDFREAAGIIADLCGGRERFLIYEDNESRATGGQSGLKILSRSDLELIGIYNMPVYVTHEAVFSFCEPERRPSFRHVWHPGDPDTDTEDYIVIEKMALKSPLLELLKDDSLGYAELIQNKAWETLEKYREIQDSFMRYSRTMARAVTPTIRRIEEILIEHGGSLRCPPEFMKERIA